MAPVDAQMIEQRDMVGGVGVPAVLRRDRRARLAAGIALIHRDDAELAGEFGRRVDRRRGLAPHLDHRLQSGRREGQDRESLTELLVMDPGTVVFKAWHLVLLHARSLPACSPVRQARRRSERYGRVRQRAAEVRRHPAILPGGGSYRRPRAPPRRAASALRCAHSPRTSTLAARSPNGSAASREVVR